jgi:hypothetical protein
MYKDSSLACDDLSTEVGDTLKSYSSKFRHLKQMRSQKATIDSVLPVKLERAALTVQRFWRRRMVLRRRLYDGVNEELDKQI